MPERIRLWCSDPGICPGAWSVVESEQVQVPDKNAGVLGVWAKVC